MTSTTVFGQESTPQVGKHVASSNIDVLSMLLSLLAVLAMIVVAAMVLKRFQIGPQATKGMKVVTSLHLGPKERLVVVEVDDKQLLLGVTAHNISILQTLENPLKPAQAIPTEWGSLFTSVIKKQ
ncbi:flagellar biosynthetic protein FliO [Thalassotalea euphylliae]|uniref:flagellar biosynthetic protein FliO n=1 Tax=Thalassotalea euphylliae TaxID=1655234 RepID=UPI003640D541